MFLLLCRLLWLVVSLVASEWSSNYEAGGSRDSQSWKWKPRWFRCRGRLWKITLEKKQAQHVIHFERVFAGASVFYAIVFRNSWDERFVREFDALQKNEQDCIRNVLLRFVLWQNIHVRQYCLDFIRINHYSKGMVLDLGDREAKSYRGNSFNVTLKGFVGNLVGLVCIKQDSLYNMVK